MLFFIDFIYLIMKLKPDSKQASQLNLYEVNLFVKISLFLYQVGL